MTEIARARERAIMIGLYLDLRGQTAKHYFPAISDPLARELTAVMAAVLLAQIKQRAATVAVVARHTGIPRVTALRRLGMLVRLGPVHRTEKKFYRVRLEVANSPATMAYTLRMRKLILRAADKLRKSGV